MAATTRRSVLSDLQMQAFDGLVLSDAHLKQSGNSSFAMSVKYYGFVAAVEKVLPLAWHLLRHYILPVDKRTGKNYEGWSLSSTADLFLRDQRARWYPKNKKIVPRDIRITPTCLLWWYIGDGSLAKKPSRPKYRRVILCTDCFTDEEIEFLMGLLRSELGNDSIYEEEQHIVIAKNALCNFVKYIGTKSPVPEYNYKFDFGQYENPDYFRESWSNRVSVRNFGDRMVKINRKPVICIETQQVYPSLRKQPMRSAIAYLP